MGRLLEGDGDLEGLIVLLHWREEAHTGHPGGPGPSDPPQPWRPGAGAGGPRRGGAGCSLVRRRLLLSLMAGFLQTRAKRLGAPGRKGGHRRSQSWGRGDPTAREGEEGARGRTPIFPGLGFQTRRPWPEGPGGLDTSILGRSWLGTQTSPGLDAAGTSGLNGKDPIAGRAHSEESAPTSQPRVGVQPWRTAPSPRAPLTCTRVGEHDPRSKEAGRMRSAGEGRAWGCAPAPALCPAGGSRPGRGAHTATIPRPRVPGVRRAKAPRAHPPACGIRPGDRRRRRPCPAPGSVCKVSRGAEKSARPPANGQTRMAAGRGRARYRGGGGRGRRVAWSGPRRAAARSPAPR